MRIQQASSSPTETNTNVRVWPFGGCPHQPIVSQRAWAGPLVASRIRREASAAPRMIVHDAASASEHPGDADHGSPERALEQARRAPERGEKRDAEAGDDEHGHAELPRAERVDHPLGVQARAAEQDALARLRLRLDLAEPVEVADTGRDVADVRDDEVSRDELDAPADDEPERATLRPAVLPWKPCRASDSSASTMFRCACAKSSGRASVRVRAISCSISRSRGLVTSIASR